MEALWAGLGVLALLTLSPGPDTFLTLRQALAHGRDAALATAMGISTGTIVHATLAGLGVSLLIANSPLAFTVLKALGAGYLAYLGLRSLREAWLLWRRRAALAFEPPPQRTALAAYRDGLATNLLNPKVAVFYVAFFPQFVKPGEPALGAALFLGLSHAAMGLLWLSGIALAAVPIGRWLAAPRRRAAVEGAAGGVLLGFGARLLRAQG